MKKIIFLQIVMLLSAGMWAESVTFEHNDWREQQYNNNHSWMSLTEMLEPSNVGTSSANTDWLKANVYNYSGNLPMGTDNHQQLIRRYNCAWLYASLFDWFTLTFATPDYTQYTYTIHFKVSVDQERPSSVVRAMLFNYGTDSLTWSSREETPTRRDAFCTPLYCHTWNQIIGDEISASFLTGSTALTQDTCDIAITLLDNGTSGAVNKMYFGFSSYRSLENEGVNYDHNTYLDACYTAEFLGYVKHVVYNPNATGIDDVQTDDIVNSGSIKDSLFVRTGCTFTGWNTQADGKGTTYAPGDSIYVDDDTKGELVLYAQWTPNQYTVHFNRWRGEGIDSVIVTYDAAMPQITIPTNADNVFLGYFSQPYGAGTKYYNADGSSAHVCDFTEAQTLYAHWDWFVPYIDAEGNVQTAEHVVEISDASDTLNAGWYVVLGEDVQTYTLTCRGDVHLILAEGARLTATGRDFEAGIQVSGENNSLTIYGQQNQSGQLIANGGWQASGIGAGTDGGSSNIFVNTSLVLFADGNNPPTTYIAHTSTQDVANDLDGKRYTIVRHPVKNVIVTLDQQGGIGGTDQVIVDEYAVMPTLSALPAFDKYIFAGYYDAPNGQGTQYYNADGSGARLWNQTENRTLYAWWLIPHVSYVDAEGNAQTADSVAEITDAASILNAGWHVVLGEDVQTGMLTCNGEVHLILADGARLTATGRDFEAGIQVSGENNSLTIYSQQNQSGQLIANGGGMGAGIGGGVRSVGSDITINGGVVTATGGTAAAGIGGGSESAGSDITINGGVVTATGGTASAGIGGGIMAAGFNITINGGTVTATGGDEFIAPGIGGGYAGSSSNIFVAESLSLAAGETENPTEMIDHTSSQDISEDLADQRYVIIWKPITDFTVTFDKQGGTGGTTEVIATYGSAMPTLSDLPTLDNYVFAGYYDAPRGQGIHYYNADGTSAREWDQTEEMTLYAWWLIPHVSYVDAEGNAQTADSVAEITDAAPILNAGWHVVLGEDVQTGMLTCNGDVHLILADGARLTATGGKFEAGIQVSGENNSLTIYSQQNQSGQLIANGGGMGAGIGGGAQRGGSNITINGGTVTAIGGLAAAGIGGGAERTGSDITINGGVVTATGGTASAGIGGGIMAAGFNITINGGTVTATGGDEFIAPGIGGGYSGGSSDIFVAESLVLKAGETENPTEIISHTYSQDMASALVDLRYIIIEPAGTPTALEEVHSAGCGVQTVKYIYDGVLYIEREGRLYNAQGQLFRH